MSLTRTQQVLGSIHEDALNDMLRAFFIVRPRYRRYGSRAFVAATSVNATQMSPIQLPGLPGGIDWHMSFEIPTVDLFKQTSQLPPQLRLGPGQFSLRTRVQLCVNGVRRHDDSKEPTRPNDKPDHPAASHQADGETCTELEVFAIGHLNSGHNGDGTIRLRLDAVELVHVTPDSLESVLASLIRMLLDAVLSQVQLPLQALRVGALRPVVAHGSDIDHDRLPVFGTA